ncbi:MAG: nicotinate-nucleotide adenylyltransferase [Burkholderiaceae bacterium]
MGLSTVPSLPEPDRATVASRRVRVGVFGGTFDPIHVGHLALARAAQESFGFDRLLLIPTGRSWQTEAAGASAEQRCDRVRIAIAGDPAMRLDAREANRDGPTYTIETLVELRAELGGSAAIVLLMGSDQLSKLSTWHRWDELLDYCHIAATQRERVPLLGHDEATRSLIETRGRECLDDAPCGSIVRFRMPAVPVSSTILRRHLAQRGPVGELLPAGVIEYIERHGLYRAE